MKSEINFYIIILTFSQFLNLSSMSMKFDQRQRKEILGKSHQILEYIYKNFLLFAHFSLDPHLKKKKFLPHEEIKSNKKITHQLLNFFVYKEKSHNYYEILINFAKKFESSFNSLNVWT